VVLSIFDLKRDKLAGQSINIATCVLIASCHAATAVELAQAGYAVVGVDYEVITFCRRHLAICPVAQK
jgi:hypothetical protein